MTSVGQFFSYFLRYLAHFKFDIAPLFFDFKGNSITYSMGSNSSRSNSYIFGQIKVKLGHFIGKEIENT